MDEAICESWRKDCERRLRLLLGQLAALFWPGPCRCCSEALPARQTACVCPECWIGLPWITERDTARCHRCDLPTVGQAADSCARCLGWRLDRSFCGLVAALDYRTPAIELHRRLKFDHQRQLVAPLARRMAVAWRIRSRIDPELVVPVPSDPLRFNVGRSLASLLARGVALRLTVPHRRALVKLESTAAQKQLSARRRRDALRRTFRAEPADVAARDVLLVDDVCTTGATIEESVRALREAGARRTAALVLARTPVTRVASRTTP